MKAIGHKVSRMFDFITVFSVAWHNIVRFHCNDTNHQLFEALLAQAERSCMHCFDYWEQMHNLRTCLVWITIKNIHMFTL